MNLRTVALKIVDDNIDNDVIDGRRTDGLHFLKSQEGHLKWCVTDKEVSVVYVNTDRGAAQ